MHVVYTLEGATTNGEGQVWHAVLEDGGVIFNAELEVNGGGGVIIEDTQRRLYLITYWMNASPDEPVSVYASLDDIGTMWAEPVELYFRDHVIQYSGITLAAPRGGVAPADYIDGGFPSGDGSDNEWVHFRIKLR